MRERTTTVYCDNCGGYIAMIMPGYSVTKYLREKAPPGAVIKEAGDFCGSFCYAASADAGNIKAAAELAKSNQESTKQWTTSTKSSKPTPTEDPTSHNS